MRNRLITILRIVLTPLALGYLFVFLPLVAGGFFGPGIPGILVTVFGIFIYFQLWMLIAEFTYQSAAGLYDIQRPYLFTVSSIRLFAPPERRIRVPTRGRMDTVIGCLLSYVLTIYGFALAYLFVASHNPDAFSGTTLNLFEAIYFSFGTASTAAYGDIIPVSVVAKVLTMLELAVGIAYAVFFFSLLASFLTERSVKS